MFIGLEKYYLDIVHFLVLYHSLETLAIRMKVIYFD